MIDHHSLSISNLIIVVNNHQPVVTIATSIDHYHLLLVLPASIIITNSTSHF